MIEQQSKHDSVDDKACGRWTEEKNGEVRRKRRRSGNVSESTLYQCLTTISLTVLACLLACWLSSSATFPLPLPAFCSFSYLLMMMPALPPMLVISPKTMPMICCFLSLPPTSLSLLVHNLLISLFYASPSLCFHPVWLVLLWMTACFQYAFQIFISETCLSV